MKYILYFLFLLLAFSCQQYDEGKVYIQNKVHNVKLESINWGDYPLAYSLIPGETSGVYNIVDKEGTFPKSYVVSFYMVRGDKRVYLKTEQAYQLNADEDLTIVITDSTVVVNPLLY